MKGMSLILAQSERV